MYEVNLHQLRVFRVVVRHGSITRAAEELVVSQPSVTAQIRSLERRFGGPLLTRRTGGVEPTEAGRTLDHYAAQVLALVDELDMALSDLRGLRTGRLRVGCSTTVGEYLLPGVLGRFRAIYPGIQMSVEIFNTATIVRQVRDHQLKLGFIGDEADDPQLSLEPIGDDALVVIAPPEHPLASQPGPLPVRALNAEGFVWREPGSATRQTGERCLRNAGIQLRTVLELGSNEAVMQAVIAGLGLGLLSHFAVRAKIQSGLLVALPVADLDCTRRLYAIWPRGIQLTSTERAFLELVRTALARPGNE